ncbi:AbrB/MazE/SpoVT family DNA-binding domain-containing protein [Candidatus Woesearchaeota archaeon]|nr:AbrB/MazE/SpoVT family DNA-binding domain-containing protein [Candidatus Woesearchaeota archaeon]
MGIAKVTRNYQVTIPKDVRRIYGITEGDTLLFAIEGENVHLLKMKEDIIDKAFGSWAIKETGVEYVKRIRKEWGKREQRIWSSPRQ